MDYLNIALNMLITLFPTIIAGLINSLLCKSNVLSKLKVPMDFGKNFPGGTNTNQYHVFGWICRQIKRCVEDPDNH